MMMRDDGYHDDGYHDYHQAITGRSLSIFWHEMMIILVITMMFIMLMVIMIMIIMIMIIMIMIIMIMIIMILVIWWCQKLQRIKIRCFHWTCCRCSKKWSTLFCRSLKHLDPVETIRKGHENIRKNFGF